MQNHIQTKYLTDLFKLLKELIFQIMQIQIGTQKILDLPQFMFIERQHLLHQAQE